MNERDELIERLTAERDKAREEVGMWKWHIRLYEWERDNFIAKRKEANRG